MNSNSKPFSIGLIIILAGIAILLGKWGLFDFVSSMLWPFFVLLPGIAFHVLFFMRVMPAGVLIPGGILTVNGLLFFVCNVFGWYLMVYLWPVFIVAVALGLYEFAMFSQSRPIAVRYVSIGLFIAAAAMFFLTLLVGAGVYVIAFLLILAGVGIIYRKQKLW